MATKLYCDTCGNEIPQRAPIMRYVYPKKAMTMDHLKKGGDGEWQMVEEMACETCMNVMLKAKEEVQNEKV